MINKQFFEELKNFRRTLHKHPEVAGEEAETAKMVKEFLSPYHPDRIIDEIGGHGLIAEYKGNQAGPAVMFRCELDGLPIHEKNDFEYASVNTGKGHLCGHDGHMTMVAGLAYYLSEKRPEKGRVLLLFQAAEETGQGAHAMLNDERFKEFVPDYVFAIHNLPGVPLNTAVLSNSNFASASSGMKIELSGKSSHAAEPELGISPASAIAKIILYAQEVINLTNTFKEFVMATPIHARLGNLAYGTSPGEGVVHLTLRSYHNHDMTLLTELLTKKVEEVAKSENLKLRITFEEIFPATVNDKSSTQLIQKACAKYAIETKQLEHPFRWSEDFGHFTSRYKGALFGLGSGPDQPALHNPDYDFPDELIPTGILIYKSIYSQLLDA